jgi:acyl dehydratase
MQSGLARLSKGHRFAPSSFTLSEQWVHDYVVAVEDEAISGLGRFAPPMSLAALAIRSLLAEEPLPPGAIHIGQELAFHQPAPIGETFVMRGEVLSRGERSGWVLMGISLAIEDALGALAMDGKATLTFPLSQESPA